MSLDRIQVVRNFTTQVIVAVTLSGTPTAVFAGLSASQLAALATPKRVGRLQVVIPKTQAVTVTDLLGGAYTVTAGADVPLFYDIKVINGHKDVLFSGTGTIAVVVYAD